MNLIDKKFITQLVEETIKHRGYKIKADLEILGCKKKCKECPDKFLCFSSLQVLTSKTRDSKFCEWLKQCRK